MVELGRPLEPDARVLAELMSRIAASGRWSNGGPMVSALEEVIARDLHCPEAVAAASGTAALTIALLACDLPQDGEVITTPLTFPATIQAIEAAGLTPIFAGVDPDTLMLDPDAVRNAITPRTVSIVPVHLFGLTASVELEAVAAEAQLPVIYDAAHAYGLPDVATRGTASAYSLHPTKLLHTGEGGAVTTDSAELAERVRRVKNFGLVDGRVRGRGTNGKMSEVNAVVGLAVHAQLEGEIRRRTALREKYAQIVARTERVSPHLPGRVRALVFEVVRCDPLDQRQLLADLAAESVIARSFPSLTEADQHTAGIPLVGASRSELKSIAASVIALPLHGSVTPQDCAAVARALRVDTDFESIEHIPADPPDRLDETQHHLNSGEHFPPTYA